MKYYAVRAGHKPGIYESWSDCREQVYKYGGAVFKSFEDREQAEEYLLQGKQDEPVKEGLPFAYIDGSYSKSALLYGYGGFLVDAAGKYHIIQGTGNRQEYAKERNIAGELLGALAAMHKCHDLGIHELNLYCDYTGTREYTTGNWKAKTPLAYHYRDNAELLGDLYGLQIHFVIVKGHTGIEGNEIADLLAKEAVGAKMRKKDAARLQEFKDRANDENKRNQIEDNNRHPAG